MAAAAAGALAPPFLPLPARPLQHPVARMNSAPSTLRSRSSSRSRLAVARASNGGDGGPPAEGGEGKRKGPSLPALSEIRWGDLLTPEPANAAAVALTAALAWAGASLLLQLTLISFAIFAAAVKYSFVAALLLFVLIALL
ncbi:uncharacterized protein LOC107305393 [Oryza brachyantha]|uniref:uncharacterized protein LOC107305393 n=1 Tax=Oryza brachyantha TaxID=4533 RepID=UPI001AD9A453|nr:uncharacterized protein LOC107305393 [Oryza brachyantha]